MLLQQKEKTGRNIRSSCPKNKMNSHIPVLLKTTIQLLKIRPNHNYIDGTYGAGGHSQAILQQNKPHGIVVALDVDPTVHSQALSKKFKHRFIYKNTNFNNLKTVITSLKPRQPFHGILFDLGLSSMQLKDQTRGFSFQKDSPLDMRMGSIPSTDFKSLKKIYPSLAELQNAVEKNTLTAYHLINFLEPTALARIFWQYGEEKASRSISKAITYQRQQQEIVTTFQLATLIARVKKQHWDKIHPATKVFQALRIATNNELENLKQALQQSLEILEHGARIAVISFHSLEDRLVKTFFGHHAKMCLCPPQAPICTCTNKPTVKLVTTKPITPSEEEIAKNPKSRSAKLRVAQII